MMMCVQNFVGFCQFVLKILSGNKVLTSIKGRNSVKILRKMTGNNPKLDLVNVDVHTKFGQILSICSQDIERKRNFGNNEEPSNTVYIRAYAEQTVTERTDVYRSTRFFAPKNVFPFF